MDFWCEIGAADGSVEYALTAARVASASGASALKVQWLKPERIFHPEATRYDNTSGEWMYQADGYSADRNIYPHQDWQPVIDQCEALGLEFIPAVFDSFAAHTAHDMGLDHVKIASGDITNQYLIKEVANIGFGQVTLSTGAATREEIIRAVNWLQEGNAPMGDLTLLACHLQYPSAVEAAHLGRIIALRDMYDRGVRIGYSDHTPGIDTVPVALAFGAQVIEKHFSLHPGEGGGDHDFAIGPEELSAATQLQQYLYAMIDNVEIEPTPGEAAARQGARRSLYAAHDIKAGSKLEPSDIRVLRPVADGAIPAERYEDFLYQTVHVDIDAGQPILMKVVGKSSASLTVE